MRSYLPLIAPLLFVVGCDNLATNGTNQRDNTSVNARDSDGQTMTPFDQSNSQKDIDLVASIRSKALEIKDLSVNGRNVKIMTKDGKVLLRGPVESAAERDAIAKVAIDLAGEANVTNNLEVSQK